jgi:hypothetical protein
MQLERSSNGAVCSRFTLRSLTHPPQTRELKVTMRFLDKNVETNFESIPEKLLYALSKPALAGSWNYLMIGSVGLSSRFRRAVQKASEGPFRENLKSTFSTPLWWAARYVKQLL